MLKLPLVAIYMILAFNITAFTVLLQIDWLTFNSIGAKIFAWIFSISAWALAYINRNKYFVLS